MRFGRERGEGGVRVGADRGGLRRPVGGAPNPSRAAARPGGTGEHLVLPGLATPGSLNLANIDVNGSASRKPAGTNAKPSRQRAILSQLHLAELADGIAGSKLRQTPARYTALRKENLSV
jgi:hypothetical protein